MRPRRALAWAAGAALTASAAFACTAFDSAAGPETGDAATSAGDGAVGEGGDGCRVVIMEPFTNGGAPGLPNLKSEPGGGSVAFKDDELVATVFRGAPVEQQASTAPVPLTDPRLKVGFVLKNLKPTPAPNDNVRAGCTIKLTSSDATAQQRACEIFLRLKGDALFADESCTVAGGGASAQLMTVSGKDGALSVLIDMRVGDDGGTMSSIQSIEGKGAPAPRPARPLPPAPTWYIKCGVDDGALENVDAGPVVVEVDDVKVELCNR